jgi:hypothetical protein
VDAPELHPDCAALGVLLGTWRGSGHGDYPTIDAFDYVEEVSFGHVGKPFLAYSQKTRDSTSGLALHAEAGYFRGLGDDAIELVIAQPSGILEAHSGTAVDGVIDLSSTGILGTPSAKQVSTVARRIEVVGDELTYDLWMSAVGEAHQLHLSARLSREV